MVKNKAPAYLWYPKDIFDSERVDSLSAAEECWYRRALDRSWSDDGIVADPVKAARRIGKNCTAKAAGKILEMFFVQKKKNPLKMVNLKQEKVRKKCNQNYLQKVKAGIASGRKRREKQDLNIEQRSNSVQTHVERSNLNKFKDSSYEESEEREKAPPLSLPHPPETKFSPGRFDHPAVILFEETFGFKTGSGFASSVADKIGDLNIWKTLLDNKRAYADKPLGERKRVCNWILDEYDKRVKEKQNGTNTRNPAKRTNAEKLAEYDEVFERYPTEAELAAGGKDGGDAQRAE